MDKKVILFLLNNEVSSLPPLMAMLDCLCKDYSLKVISCEKPGGKDRLESMYQGRDVHFLSNTVKEECLSIYQRVRRKIRRILNVSSRWHKEASLLLQQAAYDVLWIAHENAAIEFKSDLMGKEYIMNIFELYDAYPVFLKNLKPIAQRARTVIVPEYNRACMLKYWLDLKDIPTVVPNKPFTHPRVKRIDNEWAAQLAGKKVLLYQGYLNSNRNIDSICEAINSMPEWIVVLLGKGEKQYISHIENDYPNVLHLEFIQPPHHLDVTSWARIGVVKYDWYDLNHAYCAPNKIWEYAGFGIPMIGNELPGLRYTVGNAKAAVLADMDNVEDIKNAVLEIDKNYEYFSTNALTFYDSCNIDSLLKDVLRKEFVG